MTLQFFDYGGDSIFYLAPNRSYNSAWHVLLFSLSYTVGKPVSPVTACCLFECYSSFMMLRPSILRLIAAASFLTAARAAANSICYLPNGEVEPASQPCNPNAAVSHCCQNVQVCLSNGLCWDPSANNIIRSMLCNCDGADLPGLVQSLTRGQ
jgi:hypothetical protein